jgi:membrane fusion protein (multidrug efflux system)
MKNLTRLLLLTFLLAACSTPQPEEGMPEDLDGKKSLLREKRAELQELTTLIDQLEREIADQDPNISRQQKSLVITTQIVKRDFQHYAEIQGSVEADDLIDVTSETPGIILELPWKEGDYIRKGQLVARLDLEQIKKQIAEVDKSLELANIVYERQSRLWEQNIGSELQYLEAKNNKERLEKTKETLEFQLTKGEIHSPVSGVVEVVFRESGELASPGTPIIQILNPNRLKVVADVPENFLMSVKRGDQVTIQYPALKEEQTARVSQIGRTIDQSNRSFEVEVNVGNYKGMLKPNLLAIMLINDYTQKDAIIVPLDAIQEEVGGKKFVFISVDGDEGPVAKKVYVTTGESYRGDIVITNGLNGGESLIIEGSRGLANNEAIQVQTPKKEMTNG